MCSKCKHSKFFSFIFWFPPILLLSCEGIDVITSDLDQINEKKVYFEVNNIDPKSLNEFSLCGRFKTSKFLTKPSFTHEIFPGLRSVTVKDCDTSKLPCYIYKQQMGPGHYIKHVFGQILFVKDDTKEFPPWLPEVWQSFCYSVQNSTVILTINGHTKYKTLDYSGLHKWIPSFMFMNNLEKNSPFFGSMTDINIWNRTLTDDESSGWMNCKTKIDDGNIFNWENSSRNLTLSGVKIESTIIDNICESNTDKDNLIVTNDRLSFFETYSFCQRFGSMAVVNSNATARKLVEAMERSTCDRWGAFTGHTDHEKEGTFVEYGSKKMMSWTNWDIG